MADGRADAVRDRRSTSRRERREPQVPRLRILFVCTSGIARSRTAAQLFEGLALASGRCETRAVGTAPWASRRLTTRELAWADVVVVMEPEHRDVIRRFWADHDTKVHVLGIPDDYDPDEAALKKILEDKLSAVLERLT
jgi:predicted protein tyrosine phosphatase